MKIGWTISKWRLQNHFLSPTSKMFPPKFQKACSRRNFRINLAQICILRVQLHCKNKIRKKLFGFDFIRLSPRPGCRGKVDHYKINALFFRFQIQIFSDFRSHAAPLFAKHNILSVTDTCTLELGVFMLKYHIGDLPEVFNEYFNRRSDIHNYQTRHANDLNVALNKNSFTDKAIRTSGPILWNSLSSEIKHCNNVKKFLNYMWVFQHVPV